MTLALQNRLCMHMLNTFMERCSLYLLRSPHVISLLQLTLATNFLIYYTVYNFWVTWVKWNFYENIMYGQLGDLKTACNVAPPLQATAVTAVRSCFKCLSIDKIHNRLHWYMKQCKRHLLACLRTAVQWSCDNVCFTGLPCSHHLVKIITF